MPEMSYMNNFLKQGKICASEAISCDKNGHLKEAIKLYESSVALLNLGITSEFRSIVKDSVLIRIKEYNRRIKHLQQAFAEKHAHYLHEKRPIGSQLPQAVDDTDNQYKWRFVRNYLGSNSNRISGNGNVNEKDGYNNYADKETFLLPPKINHTDPNTPAIILDPTVLLNHDDDDSNENNDQMDFRIPSVHDDVHNLVDVDPLRSAHLREAYLKEEIKRMKQLFGVQEEIESSLNAEVERLSRQVEEQKRTIKRMKEVPLDIPRAIFQHLHERGDPIIKKHVNYQYEKHLFPREYIGDTQPHKATSLMDSVDQWTSELRSPHRNKVNQLHHKASFSLPSSSLSPHRTKRTENKPLIQPKWKPLPLKVGAIPDAFDYENGIDNSRANKLYSYKQLQRDRPNSTWSNRVHTMLESEHDSTWVDGPPPVSQESTELRRHTTYMRDRMRKNPVVTTKKVILRKRKAATKNKKNKDKKEKAVERKMRNARRIHISRLMKRRDSILSLPLKERAYVHVQSRLPEKKIAPYSPTRLQRQHEEDLRSVNSVISDIDALLSP
jgi:hypothetical protein